VADLTLRSQCEEARRLARSGNPLASIGVCRRILTTFPKHVGAYGILAHIMLQLGEHEQALPLYQRVLSADPEFAPAYVGVAAIHEERGLLDEAIWYLERAFELSPGDQDIHLRLDVLRAERDGKASQGLPLTRAWLVRTWMRGQLHARAADELAALTVDEPQRYDLRVALVEALWRSRRYARAATEAQTLLAELPYCLKANLVLGQVWLGSDRDEEARVVLRRAQAIDPDNVTAQALFGHRSPLPPRVARLPFQDGDAPSPDVPYHLDDADEGSAGHGPAGRIIEGRASVVPENAADTSPEALWDALRSALSWRGTVTSAPTTQPAPAEAQEVPAEDTSTADPPAQAVEPPAAEGATPGEAPSMEEAPSDGLSLIDVRRRFVEEHPDDYPARLDLARRYRDVGNLAAALEQYGRLVMDDYGTLPAVVDDLEKLNRIYLHTPALETLLARARLRESLKPPQRPS
jgi:tetratricopeptide (TPR) repeat protein